MFVVHKTQRPAGNTSFGPPVYEEPNESSAKTIVDFDHFAVLLGNGEITDDYVFVEVKPKWKSASTSGWIDRKFLSADPVPLSELYENLNDFDEKFFVRVCVRLQLAMASGGDASGHTVSAEFLVAVAMLMSKLEVFSTRLTGTDSIGPYQLTGAEWQEFLAANPDIGLTPEDRISHYQQITCATHLLQSHANALRKLVLDQIPDEKDYMPSFLDVFHAWLTSPKAAAAIEEAHSGNNKNQPVRPLIESNVADFDLAAKKCGLLIDVTDTTLSVDAFVQKTVNELNQKLKMAFNKMKEHASEYLVRPPKKAPWFPIVKQELAAWDTDGNGIPDFDEKSSQGIEKTVDYFRAIYPSWPGGSPTPAWCGAFTSFCVREAGLGDTIPDVAEGARNWRNWGNISIPTTAGSFPEGAVIMTGKSKGNEQIGHVTFYVKHLDGKGKIECIGGNQGPLGQVTRSTIDISRVVAVRWHGEVAEANDDDALVVAMTIYGEARNQEEDGQKAVASVILNRAADPKKRYGATAKDVCLKSWQFSCWNKNDPNRAIITDPDNHESAKFQKCLEIAQSALAGTLADNTGGATHYYANYIPRPSWLINNSNNPVNTKKFGVHLFYRNVDG